MKKKAISILLTLCMVMCMIPSIAMTASAANTEGRFLVFDDGVHFYQDVTTNVPNAVAGRTYELHYLLNETDKTAMLFGSMPIATDYLGAELTVLDTITYNDESYTVTAVKDGALRYNYAKIIHLPETVTAIGNNAFENCEYLEEVNIPAGVTTIGENAFWRCNALKEINIPSGITDIPKGAFGYCTSVTSLTIPSNITTIGKEAFVGLGDSSGAEIALTIPKNVMTIGVEAFSRTKAIKSITIENGRNDVLVLGSGDNGAFRLCKNLETLNILSDKVKIGKNELFDCPNLSEVTFTAGISAIGNWSFAPSIRGDVINTVLTEVVIPYTVTSIGNGVFMNCTNATVYYPKTASVESMTFQNTKTRVAYSVLDDGTVKIESVTGAAIDKLPGTIDGMKVSAVPEDYKLESKHTHYFGIDDSSVYCLICTTLNPSHEHNWSTTTYEWSADGKTCTAKRICIDESAYFETANATVTGTQTKAPTCTEKGETTYTAVFAEDWAAQQTKSLADIPANGHELESHEAKAPTCTKIGWDAYDTCKNCDYSTYAELSALGHTYGTEWKSDETSHYHECSCGDKADTAAHDLKWIVDKEAAIGVAGSKHEQCTVCGYARAAVEIPALPIPEYPPVIEAPEGGKAEVDNQAPQQGDKVTITPKPDTDNKVDKVVVTDKDGKPVEVIDNGDGTFSYIQPEGEVTIRVEFGKKPDPDSPQTGDMGNPALWFGLMLVTAMGLTGTVIWGKKRKVQ